MRLREWRDTTPRKELMGPKVLATIDEALELLGAEPDPDCWVAWGDDPAIRYTVLVPIAAGLLSVHVRVNVPGEGPRAQGKLTRWNRVQSGELSVEIQGGHRLINYQIENNVLRGKDEEADALASFVHIVFDAIDGRSDAPPNLGLRGSASRADTDGTPATPVRRTKPPVPQLPAPKETGS